MNWKRLIAPGIAVLIICGACVFCVATYYQEKIDRLTADAAAKEKDAAMAEREKAYQQQIASLDAEMKAIKTAPQATRVIEKYIPQTQNQAIEIPKADLPINAQQQLPDAPSYVVSTPLREIAIAQEQVKCQEVKTGLVKCQQDLSDTAAQRDAYKKGMKGGSFFTRLKRNAKVFIIGAAAGAVAIELARH